MNILIIGRKFEAISDVKTYTEMWAYNLACAFSEAGVTLQYHRPYSPGVESPEDYVEAVLTAALSCSAKAILAPGLRYFTTVPREIGVQLRRRFTGWVAQVYDGSMLDSATGDETGRTQEDLEANAFAGLLLMPDQLLHEQILLYGLDKDLVTVDSVLMLMDMFAMPYKAVVLRLFESGNISHQQAEKLLEVGSADVMERVSLTGKAKRWQLDGKGTESFGTLLEKVEYNRQHEYLTESRENEDVAYLAQLKKEYGLD